MKTKMNARKSVLFVIVGLLLASAALAAIPAKTATQINLNTATEQELSMLPGIGPATARSIIAARPFKSVEDLQQVKGIGAAKFNAIKSRVTVNADAATRPATRATRATRTATTTTGPIDINTADQKTLEGLPGIGPAAAQNIIAARPFKSVEDLQNVKGIGAARYNAIKSRVTVATAAARPATAATRATRAATTIAGPININTADLKTLESLPGVGPATAQSIIAARPFKNVEELQNVKGIGPAKFESLKDKVTVESGRRARIAPATTEPAPAVERRKPGAATATRPADSDETKPALPVGPIDINTADLKTLESLPGIGPVKAQAIIDHRPYAKVEDIMKVPGIKEGIFAKIKDNIVVK